jgi:hypothetical protein
VAFKVSPTTRTDNRHLLLLIYLWLDKLERLASERTKLGFLRGKENLILCGDESSDIYVASPIRVEPTSKVSGLFLSRYLAEVPVFHLVAVSHAATSRA